MKKYSLAFIAILGATGITTWFIEEAPREPELGILETLPTSTRGIRLQEEDRDLDEMRTPSSIGEVLFPHLTHIDDLEIECVECHHEVNATALNMPHEEYFEDFWIECGICHHNGEAAEREPIACAKCHPDHPTRIDDQTLSSKVVIHKNCWGCHDVGTGTEASDECSFCHSGEAIPFTPIVETKN